MGTSAHKALSPPAWKLLQALQIVATKGGWVMIAEVQAERALVQHVIEGAVRSGWGLPNEQDGDKIYC